MYPALSFFTFMTISADVIQDSISQGIRLTTLKLEFPMTLMREFNTHRVFSRNASSSRAIPAATMIAEVLKNPVIPVYWGKNQKGMQSYEEVSAETKEKALKIWLKARDNAVKSAKALNDLEIHKQYVNLLLDPFTWIRVVVTSTEWDNFFRLRTHESAKPEIRILASAMILAMDASVPVERPSVDDTNVETEACWHLPFITDEERKTIPVQDLLKMSTARNARVSYNKHDGEPPLMEDDQRLFSMLIEQKPEHASPSEHVACFVDPNQKFANFTGWSSLRHTLGI